MIQLLLMLLGLAFGNNNGNAICNDNNGGTVTTQDSGGTGLDPGTGIDPDGDTGGETIPILPPKK